MVKRRCPRRAAAVVGDDQTVRGVPFSTHSVPRPRAPGRPLDEIFMRVLSRTRLKKSTSGHCFADLMLVMRDRSMPVVVGLRTRARHDSGLVAACNSWCPRGAASEQRFLVAPRHSVHGQDHHREPAASAP